jgi:hypothetical protein
MWQEICADYLQSQVRIRISCGARTYGRDTSRSVFVLCRERPKFRNRMGCISGQRLLVNSF